MDKKQFRILIIVFSSFAIGFVLTLVVLDPVIWLGIYEQTDLAPGTKAYQQWLRSSVDIYFQAYFFNLTNPEEFIAGQKPIVRQIGPYTYREVRYKTDVFKQLLSKTLQYKEVKQYHFEPHLSARPESDIITNVNLGYLTIDVKFGWLPAVVDRAVEFLENRTGDYLITKRTVKEWLWGYEDPLLILLKSVFIPVPTTMIGLYLDKNNTDDGLIEIYASNKQAETFGHIYKYHNSKTLSCWTTQQANQINGSDGSLFHPFLQMTEHPYIFSADICRSIQIRPQYKTQLHGVPVIKYMPYADTFSSPLTTEKNRGFCINWPNCMKDNVFDVSTCIKGAPIAMSLPHLQHADPSYQELIIGLNPTDDMNTSFFVEPNTGVVFSASKKLQINAIVRRNPKFHQLSNVLDLFLPIMFMNESFNVDNKTADDIRLSVIQGPLITKAVMSTIVVILIASIIALVLYYIYRYRRTNTEVSDYTSVPTEPEIV
ncbi:Lysosome membrane protein 2 (Lysosome membrane protein II) [Paragonimus heterotremus]|uniref:Scavenger receptor class B member 1 n=1 Tax=Paragonimus heterotremus TaxID=100268 RepID=A0A8J4SH04_9TREM|nr:Lysosome membrane protein 2 (Lysosome membrane protein II) [Paragonimus heterotremus]